MRQSAGAQTLNYTYVEGGYVNSDIDAGPFNADGDGLGMRGSFAIDERYFLWDGFAVGAGLELDDDDTAWRVGVRTEFGDREQPRVDGPLSGRCETRRWFGRNPARERAPARSLAPAGV